MCCIYSTTDIRQCWSWSYLTSDLFFPCHMKRNLLGPWPVGLVCWVGLMLIGSWKMGIYYWGRIEMLALIPLCFLNAKNASASWFNRCCSLFFFWIRCYTLQRPSACLKYSFMFFCFFLLDLFLHQHVLTSRAKIFRIFHLFKRFSRRAT